MRRRGPGLIRVAATTAVVAGTAGAISHRQQQRYANQEAEQQAAQQALYDQGAADAQAQMQAQQAAAAPAAAPAAAQDPTMAELQKLASLHSSGVLTDEEFAAAKAKLLGI
jgi:hypothetical protein